MEVGGSKPTPFLEQADWGIGAFASRATAPGLRRGSARGYTELHGAALAGRRRGDVLRRLGPSTWDEFLYCPRLDLDSAELFLKGKVSRPSSLQRST